MPTLLLVPLHHTAQHSGVVDDVVHVNTREIDALQSRLVSEPVVFGELSQLPEGGVRQARGALKLFVVFGRVLVAEGDVQLPKEILRRFGPGCDRLAHVACDSLQDHLPEVVGVLPFADSSELRLDVVWMGKVEERAVGWEGDGAEPVQLDFGVEEVEPGPGGRVGGGCTGSPSGAMRLWSGRHSEEASADNRLAT